MNLNLLHANFLVALAVEIAEDLPAIGQLVLGAAHHFLCSPESNR